MPLNILITGANRGIGLEFCRQYLALGARVFACCRQPDQALNLQALLFEHPESLSIIPLDITDEAQHQTLRESLTHTQLDLLINNAGTYGSKGLELSEVGAEEWSQVLKVNAIYPTLLTRNLIPNLSTSAKVAFITSKMGSMSDNHSGGSYIYRSSKAALNAAARSLSIDLQNQGIQVAILHPGWVKTDMGGPNALITTEQSVTGMRSVIESLCSDDSGNFFNYDGSPIPW